MKKFVGVLALVLFVFGICLSCAKKENGSEQPGSKKKEKYVVGFSQIGSESEWRIANSNEMQAAYEKNPRFTLIFSDAQQKQENQIAAMRNFIQQKVDVIVFCAIVATGWDAILTEAKDAGIPVIMINRGAKMVAGDIEQYTVCLISPDNVYAGELLGTSFVESFGNEPGPIYIAEMQGTVGASSAVDRGQGLHKVLDNNSRFVIKYSQTGDYTRSTAKQVMESMLKSAQADGIKLRGLVSHNDDMAIGASQAIAEAGLRPGVDIKIAGIDGVRGAFEAMAEGRYTASVENPLGYGNKTIEIITELLDNGNPPSTWWVVLKNEVYTEANAAAALPNRVY